MTQKRMNKLDLSVRSPNLSGGNLLGELVSCVCHRGSVNRGHFISYQKVGNDWFLNDDSIHVHETQNPFEATLNETETVELLFYVNDI